MTNEELIHILEKNRPSFLDYFNCKIIHIAPVQGLCEMEFEVSKDYCHSGNVIQGGFITVMLDAVSSHALMATDLDTITNVSTIELKVSYYAPSLAGRYRAIGKVEKQGNKIAFLSGELINEDRVTTAVLNATAKIIRSPIV